MAHDPRIAQTFREATRRRELRGWRRFGPDARGRCWTVVPTHAGARDLTEDEARDLAEMLEAAR